MTPLLPSSTTEPVAIRLLGELVDWAIVVLGSALIVIVFVNVVLHQVDYDISMTTEFGELVMVWTTFLGAAAASRRRGHMAVTELVDFVGGRAGVILRVAIEIVVVFVLGILIWYGVIIEDASWGNILTVLDVPMAWQYLALPIGAGVSLVFVVYHLLVLLRTGRASGTAWDLS